MYPPYWVSSKEGTFQIGKEIVDKNKKIDEQNCKNKGACLPCFDDEKA